MRQFGYPAIRDHACGPYLLFTYRMGKSVQIRVRVRRDLASKLLALKPRARGKLVSAGIGAVLNGRDTIAALSESLEQIRRIGVNLNQLVYLAHSNRTLSDSELRELRSVLGEVKTLTG